jgi:nitrite reductase/ring-hydroxylating ferredoxin subunit
MTGHRLCHTSDIPEPGSKGFKLGDLSFFAVRKAGEIFLYRNSCPHIGVALEWVEDQFLDSSQTLIQCANHGALFSITNGKCVSGPCIGQSLIAVPFTINDGYIELNTI